MTAREVKRQSYLVEWKERVIACRSSGNTVREWCKEQGINTKTYCNWEQRVLQAASEQLAAQASAPQFAELPAPAPKAEISAGTGEKLAARINVGTATVELYEGASTELAAAVCRAMSHAE